MNRPADRWLASSFAVTIHSDPCRRTETHYSLHPIEQKSTTNGQGHRCTSQNHINTQTHTHGHTHQEGQTDRQTTDRQTRAKGSLDSLTHFTMTTSSYKQTNALPSHKGNTHTHIYTHTHTDRHELTRTGQHAIHSGRQGDREAGRHISHRTQSSR